MNGSEAAARLPSYGGDYRPSENRDDGSFAAVQRAGNRAYDLAIAGGNECGYDAYRETTTGLTAQLKAGELWLCPACCRELAPADALCVHCEGEERDASAEREANGRLRHGRG